MPGVTSGVLPAAPFDRRRWGARPRLAIKCNGRILLLNVGEVISVEAEGNYVVLVRKSGSNMLREQISAIYEKLKPFGFIRIHRSVLVNPAFVEELHPLLSGNYEVQLKTGKTYTLSRSFRSNLQQFASLWFGISAFAGE